MLAPFGGKPVAFIWPKDWLEEDRRRNAHYTTVEPDNGEESDFFADG